MILFPSTPGSADTLADTIDPSFYRERNAALGAGFKVGLYDPAVAFGAEAHVTYPRGVPETDHFIYRGWLMRHAAYERLSHLVGTFGHPMLVPVEAYRNGLELPRWYPALPVGSTPRSIWFPQEEYDLLDTSLLARRISESFDGPVMIKDYIKSAKGMWWDAVFIPSARDVKDVGRVVHNFLDKEGSTLVGGLVVREFVDFKKIGTHEVSKMPLAKEVRYYLYRGKVFFVMPYWQGEYGTFEDDREWVEDVAKGIDSPYCTVDVAELETGGKLVVEVNDGGCAGVRPNFMIDYYKALAEALGV